MPALKQLSLADNGLKGNATDFISLMAAKAKKLELQKLDLSGNAVGDDSVFDIAKVIRHCPTLLEVNVANNGFSFHSWSVIARAATGSKSLA